MKNGNEFVKIVVAVIMLLLAGLMAVSAYTDSLVLLSLVSLL